MSEGQASPEEALSSKVTFVDGEESLEQISFCHFCQFWGVRMTIGVHLCHGNEYLRCVDQRYLDKQGKKWIRRRFQLRNAKWRKTKGYLDFDSETGPRSDDTLCQSNVMLTY